LVEKYGGKRALSKPRRRYDSNKWILEKQDTRELTGFNWLRIGINEGLVKFVINFRFPKKVGNLLTS
jgi:hypothetical protein